MRLLVLWLLGFGLILGPIARAELIDDIDELDRDRAAQPRVRPAPSPTPSPMVSAEPQSQSVVISPVPIPRKSSSNSANRPQTNSQPLSNETARKAPVHIKSDGQLTYARQNGVIHMTKNVIITQTDLRFQADEARVWVNEGNAENNVEKVECLGNVRLAKDAVDPADKVSARSERAFFYNNQQKVVLQGDARLWRGGHLIKGATIVYTLADGMITVERAEGVVQPEGSKKPLSATPTPTPRQGLRK